MATHNKGNEMGGYPDGATQAMHDAAFASWPEQYANAIQREVEYRAEQEVATCARLFVDWLMDRNDISDLSRMIAFYKSGRTTDCRTIVDNIVQAYQQYRVATLDANEENEIAEGL